MSDSETEKKSYLQKQKEVMYQVMMLIFLDPSASMTL